jgi:hypothetical protein
MDGQMTGITTIVGGTIDGDAAAILDAWHRTERGETVHERVLYLEVLTDERE